MKASDVTWIVTGGAGYIGSHVADELLSAGYKVVVIDDLSTGRIEFLPRNAEFVQGSILESHVLNEAFKIANISKVRGIMHVAGVKLAGESVANPEKYWLTNTMGTFQLARKAAKEKISSFVFSSSCSVYGTVQNKLVTEDHPTNPQSPYGKSKLTSEFLLKDILGAAGISCISLRYFNVVGSSNTVVRDHSIANLFPAILKSVEDNGTLLVHGSDYPTKDGSCIRDYLHVSDLSIGHLKAGELSLSKKPLFDVFNLGTGIGTSVFEILDCFSTILNQKIQFKIGPRRLGDPSIIAADVSKANEILGWEARYDLTEMVKSSLRVGTKE